MGKFDKMTNNITTYEVISLRNRIKLLSYTSNMRIKKWCKNKDDIREELAVKHQLIKHQLDKLKDIVGYSKSRKIAMLKASA